MATIDATARVADGARIGDGVEVGPYCLVGPHVELKDGVHLTGNETLERARTLFDEMQREYASGNFARYGELLQQLGKLLQAQ